jgi:signal transduction histidine kinase
MSTRGEIEGGWLGQHRDWSRALQDAGAVASREQDEFVVLLAQEIRTNLQAMLGFAQLMQRDQKEPLADRQGERARCILDAGDHLLHLVDDACALSRIQTGQMPVTIQAVDVLHVFQRVRAELEPLAVSRKLELAIVSSSVPCPHVAADPWGVTEIVLKLAANAIAYNKPQGKVTLQVSPIASARLRISVIDTGIGIGVDEQRKLFRPFPHVARERPGGEGAGLALATCRRLAVSMGGSVGCRSVPDQGSEFWVDLPAHPGAAVAVIPEA